jgi:TldD protein
MRETLARAVEAARGYVEVSLRRRWSTAVVFRRQRLEVATEYHAFGGVARCLLPGCGWGAVAFVDPDRAIDAVRRAAELSHETLPERPIVLAPIPIRQLEEAGEIDGDPRLVPLAHKRELLEGLTAELTNVDRRVVDSRTSYGDMVVESWLATSEGVWLHGRRAESTLAAVAMASSGGATERALGSLATPGGWGAAAREGGGVAEGMFRQVAERAVGRLEAGLVPPGRYPFVFDPRVSGGIVLQGLINLCRAPSRGLERDLLPLGTRIGPEALSVGDDPTAPGLRATVSLDDEGTPAIHTMVVQNGVVVGHLHTRETAARAGVGPTGHALAPALRSIPAARPTNPYLAKGKGAKPDLIADLPLGIYVGDLLGLAVEGRQLTITPAMAWMVRQGVLAEPVKCPPISADLFAFFGRLDQVGGDFAWDQSAASLHEAGPLRPITTGAPHTRFLDLEVGSLYS